MENGQSKKIGNNSDIFVHCEREREEWAQSRAARENALGPETGDQDQSLVSALQITLSVALKSLHSIVLYLQNAFIHNIK